MNILKRVLFLICCVLPLYVPVAAAASPVAMVEAFSNGEGLEDFCIMGGPTLLLEGAANENDPDTIVIKPLIYPAIIELFNGVLTPEGNSAPDGESTYSIELYDGDGFILSTTIAEGVPDLIIAVQAGDEEKKFWAPAYSGADGALLLDEGFTAWDWSKF